MMGRPFKNTIMQFETINTGTKMSFLGLSKTASFSVVEIEWVAWPSTQRSMRNHLFEEATEDLERSLSDHLD